MVKGASTNAMDRISELPVFIIHQILSYLSTKESTRTSVLSKTWLRASSTTPILDFDQSLFFKSAENNKKKFFSSVKSTLFRCYNSKSGITEEDNRFVISLFGVVDQASAYILLDYWIGTAIEQGVKDLNIFVARTELSPYTSPPTLIFTTSTIGLTDLRVCYCNFPSSFAYNAINFPSLKKLILDHAHIDDGMLQKLLAGCPSVERIVFFHVLGFKKFLVSNLGELKVLQISLCHDQAIEVSIEDTPSLHFFSFWGHSQILPSYLKVSNLQNLKQLELGQLFNHDSSLEKTIAKCPVLEVLHIICCYGLERINISSRLLKHLLLKGCENLVEVSIDVPNLLTLGYIAYKVLPLSLVKTRGELKISVNIAHRDFVRPDFTWFHQLRKLVTSLNRANVSLTVWLEGLRFDIHLHLVANQLPLDLENGMLEIDQCRLSLSHAFVETLFSSYWPTIITTQKLLGPEEVSFIDILSKELIMAAGDSYDCSCDQQTTKCWRHYLEDVKVEIYDHSKNAWRPLPCKTFLDEPRSIGGWFRFSLTWIAPMQMLLQVKEL